MVDNIVIVGTATHTQTVRTLSIMSTNNNNNNNSKLGMRIKNHESINDEELTPPTPFNETKVDVALTSFEERLRKKMARLSQDSTATSSSSNAKHDVSNKEDNTVGSNNTQDGGRGESVKNTQTVVSDEELNGTTKGTDLEEEDIGNSIGSWGRSYINELQPPPSTVQIAQSVWTAATTNDDEDDAIKAKIKSTDYKITEHDSNPADDAEEVTNTPHQFCTSTDDADVKSQQSLGPEEVDGDTIIVRRDRADVETETLHGSLRAEEESHLSRPRSRSLMLPDGTSTRTNASSGRRRQTDPTNDAIGYSIGRRFSAVVSRVSNIGRRNQALRELANIIGAEDVVQAHLVEEEAPIEIVDAIPMADEDDEKERKRRRLKKQLLLIWGPIIVAAVVIVVVFVGRGGSETDTFDDDKEGEEDTVKVPAEQVYDPTLIQIRKEGVLRCGVSTKYGFGGTFNNATGEQEGMTVDLCKAVAAALLGPEYQVDVVHVTSANRFTLLAGREIDLLLYGDTHTMERDFYEVRLNHICLHFPFEYTNTCSISSSIIENNRGWVFVFRSIHL